MPPTQDQEIAKSTRSSVSRAIILTIPILCFVGLLWFFAAGLQRDPQELPSALIDQPAPAFDLPAVTGDQPGLTLKDLGGGKPALVNFFASWCTPCRAEQPILLAFVQSQSQLASGAVPLYGIDYKDKADDARDYLASSGNPYQRIGADRNGRTGIDFGIYGVPETFIIDKIGRIRFRYPGPMTQDVLEREILPRLKQLQAS